MTSLSQTTGPRDAPFIVAFYTPNASNSDANNRDVSGRTLDDILAFSDEELEYHHDFIQYLFPLPERSPINPSAPVITAPVRTAFLSRPDLRRQLFRSMVRMLEFYGFEVLPTATVDQVGSAVEEDNDAVHSTDHSMTIVPLNPRAKFYSRARQTWLKSFGHNHLRITRILRCLRILGLGEEAQRFLDALMEADEKGVVGKRTWVFWKRAVERPLHLPPQQDDEDAEGVAWLRGEV